MRSKIKNTLINLATVIILALLFYLGGGYFSAAGGISYFLFLHGWALLAGGYFARAHLRTWIGEGKFFLEKGYIILPLLYILCYTPLFGSVILKLPASAIPLFAVFAAYNLVMSVCRE